MAKGIRVYPIACSHCIRGYQDVGALLPIAPPDSPPLFVGSLPFRLTFAWAVDASAAASANADVDCGRGAAGVSVSSAFGYIYVLYVFYFHIYSTRIPIPIFTFGIVLRRCCFALAFRFFFSVFGF